MTVNRILKEEKEIKISENVISQKQKVNTFHPKVKNQTILKGIKSFFD